MPIVPIVPKLLWVDYQQIVNEEWSSSYWRHTLAKRFLFVVFQKDCFDIPRFKEVLFWTMPSADLATAKRFWEHTRAQVRRNDFDHFIAISDGMLCHVRPKARDSRDTAPTASGGVAPKKAYWLNSAYIRDIVA